MTQFRLLTSPHIKTSSVTKKEIFFSKRGHDENRNICKFSVPSSYVKSKLTKYSQRGKLIGKILKKVASHTT